MPRILLKALVITVFTAATAVDAQDARHIDVADYLDLEQVSDAQISPDGRQVVYTRRWVDRQADT